MPRIETKSDYYAIIGVANTATLHEIKKSYHNRARDLHPDKNHSNPNATAEFQRLGEAYETLKDPDKRRAYDIRWPGIRTNEQADKSRREAAEANQRQAAQEAAKTQKAEEERESRLKRLIAESNRYRGDVFEANRRVKKLTVEIARLHALDDEETRKEKERNSWWTYLSSPIYGKAQETEDEKRHREVERLQRVASRSIKKNELAREEADLQRFKDFLKSTSDKINAECKRREDERREADARTRAAEAKKQAEFEKQQAEARRVEQQRIWAEIRKKQQEANQLAKEQRERLEKEQAAAAEAYRKLEQQRREERTKREEQRQKEIAELARGAARDQRHTRNGNIVDIDNRRTICQHEKFWPKIEGGSLCSNCHHYQPKFAFRCPGCKMMACATCRKSLRAERHIPYRGRGKSHAGPKSRQEACVDDHSDDFY